MFKQHKKANMTRFLVITNVSGYFLIAWFGYYSSNYLLYWTTKETWHLVFVNFIVLNEITVHLLFAVPKLEKWYM